MIRLIGWSLRTALIVVVILVGANTLRYERRTLNEHFVSALERVQLTSQAQTLQRGMAGWMDTLSTSKSHPRGKPQKESRRGLLQGPTSPENAKDNDTSSWERRELEKILRQ